MECKDSHIGQLESALVFKDETIAALKAKIFWMENGVKSLKEAFAYQNVSGPNCGCLACCVGGRNMHDGMEEARQNAGTWQCSWQPQFEAKLNELQLTFGMISDDTPQYDPSAQWSAHMVATIEAGLITVVPLPLELIRVVAEYEVPAEISRLSGETQLDPADLHFALWPRQDWVTFYLGKRLWSAFDPQTNLETSKLVALFEWIYSDTEADETDTMPILHSSQCSNGTPAVASCHASRREFVAVIEYE